MPLGLEPLEDAIEHGELTGRLHQVLERNAVIRHVRPGKEERVVAALAKLHEQRLQLPRVARIKCLLLAFAASAAAVLAHLRRLRCGDGAALAHQKASVPKRSRVTADT